MPGPFPPKQIRKRICVQAFFPQNRIGVGEKFLFTDQDKKKRKRKDLRFISRWIGVGIKIPLALRPLEL